MIGAMMVEEVNDYAVKMFGARDRNELLGPTNWLWAKSMETPRRAFEGRYRGEEFFQEPTKLMTRDGRVIDALYTLHSALAKCDSWIYNRELQGLLRRFVHGR